MGTNVLERPEIASPNSIASSSTIHRAEFDPRDLNAVELRIMGGSGIGYQGDELGPQEILARMHQAVTGNESAYERVMTPVNILFGTKPLELVAADRANLAEARRLKSLISGAFKVDKEVVQTFVKAGVQPYIEPASVGPTRATRDSWRVFLFTGSNGIHPNNEELLNRLTVLDYWRGLLYLDKPAPLLPEELWTHKDSEPLAFNSDGSPNFLVLKMGIKLDTTKIPPAFQDFATFW